MSGETEGTLEAERDPSAGAQLDRTFRVEQALSSSVVKESACHRGGERERVEREVEMTYK